MSDDDNDKLIDRLKEKLSREPELIPKPPAFLEPPVIDDLGGLRTLMKDSIDHMEAQEFQQLFTTVFGLNETVFCKLQNQLDETKKTIRRLWLLIGALGGTVVAGVNIETVTYLVIEFLKFIAQAG